MSGAEGRDRPVGDVEASPDGSVDELALAQLAEVAAAEGAAISAARGRAGPRPDLPAAPTGSLLRWLASTSDPRAVVEIGSACGLSGLHLLAGMGPRATLTSIERDSEARELAAEAFAEAGVTGRVRSIPGEPLDALARLTDDGYDLVVIRAVNGDHARLLDEVRRVLRGGGVLVAYGVAAAGEPELRRRRALVQTLVDDEAWAVAVLPFDRGIAVATLRTETRGPVTGDQ